MKKTIYFFFALMFVAAISKAQIPNSGFENWTNMGTYYNPDNWGTMNNITTMGGVYTCIQATPGSPGSYYMKLTSQTVASVVVNGIAVSGQLDTMTMQPISGFSFNQRPASFTGKWQHMIFGSSQGSVSATLTRWDNTLSSRVTVATAYQDLTGMAMSWANFSISFTYMDGNYPDTCIIVLKASGANPTASDYLWVDNLAFTGSVTGINNPGVVKGLNVYPNPTTENVAVEFNLVNAENVKLQITNLSGKVIKEKELGTIQGNSKYSIETKGLAKGSYFLNVISGEGADVRKIVIQ